MTASAILLVRHAEPVAPTSGTPGPIDAERPLTSDGKRAAATLARRLRDEPIGAVFSSPYRRALDTVEPIAAAHGLVVHVHQDLRERRLASATLPERPFRDALERARREPSFSLPGGESSAEVLDRALRALGSIFSQTPSGTAFVGTHGGLISILRWHVGMEFTVDEALAEPMPCTYRFTPSDLSL